MTDQTIEPDGDGSFWVVEHGEYEESSVLAGQYRRQLVEHFDTVAEAATAYPNAVETTYPTSGVSAVVPDVAPDWFDPADAGSQPLQLEQLHLLSRDCLDRIPNGCLHRSL